MALCRETGFARLTIEAIAERAGVSKKTIYRWWPSKGAILLEAVFDAAATIAPHGDTGDLAGDMHAQLMGVVALLTPQDASPVAAIIAEAQRDPAIAVALREQVIEPNIAFFDERMRSAQRAGEIPADADLGVALDLFYGPIYHRLVFHLGLPNDEEMHARVDHVIAALRTVGTTHG